MQHRPRGLDPITIAIVAAIAVGTAAATYFLMPRPNLNDMGAGKDSPNNQFHGQTNLPRPYQAWPDIFGSYNFV